MTLEKGSKSKDSPSYEQNKRFTAWGQHTDSMNCSELGIKECDEQGISKFCFEVEEGFKCDCPSWWGFTGDRCDESSAQLVYYKTTSIAFLVLALFTFCLDISNAVTLTKFYIKASTENKGRVKKARLRPLLILGIIKHILFLSFVSINIKGSFSSVEEFVLDNVKSFVRQDFEYIFPVNTRLFYFLLYGSFSTLVLQTVAIYVSWVNLLYSLPNFLIHFRFHKLAVFVGKSSPYIVGIYFLAWVIVISLGYFADTVIVTSVIAVVYVVVGLLTRRDMKLTLSGNNFELSEDLKGVVFLILRSSALFLISWLFLWIGVAVNVVGGDIALRNPPGPVNLGMVGQDISVVSGFFLSCTVSWYISRIISNFTPNFTTRKLRHSG